MDQSTPPATMTKTLISCAYCGLKFQPVDWMPHRVNGFCDIKCQNSHQKALDEASLGDSERAIEIEAA